MTIATRIRGGDLLGVLRILSTVALEGTGWVRKGVRGWVFTDEVRDGLAGVNLTDLAQLGFIVREDVRDSGRRLPLYLNRITQAGEDELAAAEERAPSPIPRARRILTPADTETIYVPTGAWQALWALAREPMEDPWRSLAQINGRAGTAIYSEDTEFLLARDLAAIQRPQVVSRTSPVLYRATSLGRGARVRDRKASGSRVQIRVPGITLRPE
jgi:hypothetical protein